MSFFHVNRLEGSLNILRNTLEEWSAYNLWFLGFFVFVFCFLFSVRICGVPGTQSIESAYNEILMIYIFSMPPIFSSSLGNHSSEMD